MAFSRPFSHISRILNTRLGVEQKFKGSDFELIREKRMKMKLCVFGIKTNPGQTVFIADHKKTIRISGSLKRRFYRETLFGDLPD